MASSGYFSNRRPLLFDRGTESLWIEEGDVLKSLAGKSKGQQLTRVAKPVPVTWDSWLAKNPRGRLVVGADRSQADPHGVKTRTRGHGNSKPFRLAATESFGEVGQARFRVFDSARHAAPHHVE